MADTEKNIKATLLKGSATKMTRIQNENDLEDNESAAECKGQVIGG